MFGGILYDIEIGTCQAFKLFINWGIAFVNFIEMLNAEVRRQNSDEQFYPVNSKNDGMFVLLTPKQLDFVLRNYSVKNENPTIMSTWKSMNGL